jgi:hypothetical protein
MKNFSYKLPLLAKFKSYCETSIKFNLIVSQTAALSDSRQTYFRNNLPNFRLSWNIANLSAVSTASESKARPETLGKRIPAFPCL